MRLKQVCMRCALAKADAEKWWPIIKELGIKAQ
jgi:hypothetical protein